VSRRAVTVVGVGDDGCLGLPARAMNAIARAEVLVGGERLLAFFAESKAEKIAIKGGLGPVLDKVAARADEHDVVVLGSGDPLFYGIGAQVVARLGAEHVEVLPHPSSIQWAFARVGQPWHDAALLSLHGRGRRGLAVRLRRASRAAILTDDENSPPRLAAHLLEHSVADFTAWVCENLAGPGERIRRFTLDELAALGPGDVAPLNVLILARTDPAWRPPPAIAYLPEDAFARRVPKKGLITKREVRVLSIAALQVRPDATIWDIGAGSGSVAIEAALLAPDGRAFAVEIDEECVGMARDNVKALGADNVEVIHGLAPAALADLPDPDAVFVGGSKGAMNEVIEVALARLRPGGRLVVNAITLDNVAEAYQGFRARGLLPELVVASCARGEPLARYLRYEAQNPVHIFAVEKARS
jgi:precorrin-6Y C5,15-methyltransferase (decarboxylating)